jgi:hypothetical protein
MADIKLARLPDRALIKLVINIAPELDQMLADYATIYAQTYGKTESVADLVPGMIAGFLESDRGFLRARVGLATPESKS